MAISTTSDLDVIYTFDHGDGYSEVANPSYATYHQAGTYHVSVTAFHSGTTTHVPCGTVTAYTEAPVCPTHSLFALDEADAYALIRAAGCDPVTASRGFEIFPVSGEYRTDRVQLALTANGVVLSATIG